MVFCLEGSTDSLQSNSQNLTGFAEQFPRQFIRHRERALSWFTFSGLHTTPKLSDDLVVPPVGLSGDRGRPGPVIQPLGYRLVHGCGYGLVYPMTP